MDTRLQLRHAVCALQLRGLKSSAKWAAEQLSGLAAFDVDGHGGAGEIHRNDDLLRESSGTKLDPASPAGLLLRRRMSDCSDRYLLAKSFFDVGEYRRAAYVLQAPGVGTTPGETDESPAPPDSALLIGLTGEELFLKAYALYLAGEKVKEQEVLELSDALDRSKQASNPNLKPLHHELANLYALGVEYGVNGSSQSASSRSGQGGLDAFGLYIFGVILKDLAITGINNGKFPEVVTAQMVLAEAAEKFPWNWSAWLDLTELCIDGSSEQAEKSAMEKSLSLFTSSAAPPAVARESFCAENHRQKGSFTVSQMATQNALPMHCASAASANDDAECSSGDRLSFAIQALSPFMDDSFMDLQLSSRSSLSEKAMSLARRHQRYQRRMAQSKGPNGAAHASSLIIGSSVMMTLEGSTGSVRAPRRLDSGDVDRGDGECGSRESGLRHNGDADVGAGGQRPHVPWAKRFFLAHACVELGGQRECEAALASLMSLRGTFPHSSYLLGQVSLGAR